MHIEEQLIFCLKKNYFKIPIKVQSWIFKYHVRVRVRVQVRVRFILFFSDHIGIKSKRKFGTILCFVEQKITLPPYFRK